MGATEQQSVDGLPIAAKIFYRNSGIFDLDGHLRDDGTFDTAKLKRIQSGLGGDEMLIVVDLRDTWMRPVKSAQSRERMFRTVLTRAPFLVTKDAVYYVTFSGDSGRSYFPVGDMTVYSLSRNEALSRILAHSTDGLHRP